MTSSSALVSDSDLVSDSSRLVSTRLDYVSTLLL